jgi:hypothetical protein
MVSHPQIRERSRKNPGNSRNLLNFLPRLRIGRAFRPFRSSRATCIPPQGPEVLRINCFNSRIFCALLRAGPVVPERRAPGSCGIAPFALCAETRPSTPGTNRRWLRFGSARRAFSYRNDTPHPCICSHHLISTPARNSDYVLRSAGAAAPKTRRTRESTTQQWVGLRSRGSEARRRRSSARAAGCSPRRGREITRDAAALAKRPRARYVPPWIVTRGQR